MTEHLRTAAGCRICHGEKPSGPSSHAWEAPRPISMLSHGHRSRTNHRNVPAPPTHQTLRPTKHLPDIMSGDDGRILEEIRQQFSELTDYNELFKAADALEDVREKLKVVYKELDAGASDMMWQMGGKWKVSNNVAPKLECLEKDIDILCKKAFLGGASEADSLADRMKVEASTKLDQLLLKHYSKSGDTTLGCCRHLPARPEESRRVWRSRGRPITAADAQSSQATRATRAERLERQGQATRQPIPTAGSGSGSGVPHEQQGSPADVSADEPPPWANRPDWENSWVRDSWSTDEAWGNRNHWRWEDSKNDNSGWDWFLG